MASQRYPTSISLSKDVRRRLQDYGKPRGWAVSRLVEYIIREWLIRQAKEEKRLKL